MIQIGLDLETVNWIMGCIQSASFAVLINGSTSKKFRASRGIRQGCPLSPLLFLLVIEGLSRLIQKAKVDGRIKGIQISRDLFLTHLMFVDDIKIMGSGSINEWSVFFEILLFFVKSRDCLLTIAS